MKETISVRSQILWFLLLSLYPVASAALLYFIIPKNTGYGGLGYDMLAVFYFIFCLIVNIIFICQTSKKRPHLNKESWVYMFPVLSPVLCGFWLVPV
ncbi:hypothetical protein [Yersinia rochesterensis]|uniref:hypothetical protein n=1 Tax=Yersinia rochesterensis TaxID=1604335 RepID=UPI0011A438F5|nr:hypothetical protein [Yersinia rochesterensis]